MFVIINQCHQIVETMLEQIGHPDSLPRRIRQLETKPQDTNINARIERAPASDT